MNQSLEASRNSKTITTFKEQKIKTRTLPKNIIVTERNIFDYQGKTVSTQRYAIAQVNTQTSIGVVTLERNIDPNNGSILSDMGNPLGIAITIKELIEVRKALGLNPLSLEQIKELQNERDLIKQSRGIS